MFNKKENSSPDVFDTLIGVNTFWKAISRRKEPSESTERLRGTLK